MAIDRNQEVKNSPLDGLLLGVCFVLVIILTFQLGVYTYQRIERQEVNMAVAKREQELRQLQLQLKQLETELAQLELDNNNYANREAELLTNINNLRSRVAGISTQSNSTNRYPFAVPSTGVVGSINGTFGGQMYTMKHWGIDIWTSQARGGQIASHKGNPVYSACDGTVVSFDNDNGGMTISCNEISGNYNVPKKKVYTHYAHMGHADTKALYFTVKRNERVTKGQLIGYQGDLSSFFPEMRNVHLHFSVFTGNSETDANGGAINPCLYIGGNCQRKGEVFTVKN